MEDSYETFEEELGPRRTDPPNPLKPLRQTRRPEMYATRKFREELAPPSHQIRAETKSFTRNPEQNVPKMTSLQKPSSTQIPSQVEVPWENVTLNRCLFVAITILVITSGFQRLHETLRGRGSIEEREEKELMLRKAASIRHRGPQPEPDTSLWEVMFWWLPDLSDEDEGRTRKSKKRATSSGFRHKILPDRDLLKERDENFKDRREKKGRGEENKDKKEREYNRDGKKRDDGCNEKISPEKKKVEEKRETMVG